MASLKQYLIEEAGKQIKEAEEEIEKSDKEFRILVGKLKVETKMSGMKDIPEGISEDVKYSIQALEGMVMMEKDRNAKLRQELKVLIYRKQVLKGYEFDDDNL